MTALALPTIQSARAAAALEPRALPAADVEGLYVHIPFCFHKCHYCDFYSITRQGPERMERFVELMLREADEWLASRPGPTPRPRTVFFGGGTPSLLPEPLMRRLIEGLRERFDFAGLEEWTVECNPATVSRDYCGMLRKMGVDRLSFGAQSFDPAELRTLERHHDPADVAASLAMARDAGFERLNIDLIYAIPAQSLESWMRSLEAAIALGTTHLSCYALTYEPNTPMAVKKRQGTIEAAPDELELAMMRHTRERLIDAGLPPYEISNYASSGQGAVGSGQRKNDSRGPVLDTGTANDTSPRRLLSPPPAAHCPPPTHSNACRHNLMYWNGGNYIGLGPSAASHVEGWRWKNKPHLGEWERAVEADTVPAMDAERLTPRQRAGELAMLQLRLTEGIRVDQFLARTNHDPRELFAPQIEQLARVGLIACDGCGITLTDSGLPVADAVAAEFLE